MNPYFAHRHQQQPPRPSLPELTLKCSKREMIAGGFRPLLFLSLRHAPPRSSSIFFSLDNVYFFPAALLYVFYFVYVDTPVPQSISVFDFLMRKYLSFFENYFICKKAKACVLIQRFNNPKYPITTACFVSHRPTVASKDIDPLAQAEARVVWRLTSLLQSGPDQTGTCLNIHPLINPSNAFGLSKTLFFFFKLSSTIFF